MVRPAFSSTLPSTYDDFLYAEVAQDANGMSLSVLSVLARQNVDPWVEAADLSALPQDIAKRKLISMIMASPNFSSTLVDPTAVARRLIDLLPGRAAPSGGKHRTLPGAPDRSPAVPKLLLIAIYVAVMLCGQWMAAGIFERAQADRASVPTAASKPADTKLRETLPSITVAAKPADSAP